MIQARHLTKRYGVTVAVRDLSFDVPGGRVTGFLGPNGAGKSTTMRMIMGLDAPASGEVTIGGTPYARLPDPLRTVGALLDARAFHGARSARNHLLWLAASNRIPRRRVDEVIGLVGLADVAGKRAGGFSLGMGQRLGIAAALLGDPGVLLFDEPVNGLDPEGIVWIRTLLRSLAGEGRTVFVSSHLMSEMALTADHLVVIGRGELIADTSVRAFLHGSAHVHVRVQSPQASALAQLLEARGAGVTQAGDDALAVTGLDRATVGDIAAAGGLVLHELALHEPSLETAYMQLTHDATDYRATTPARHATKGSST
jgi:ABC-2 type transport system ATP-binding protein